MTSTTPSARLAFAFAVFGVVASASAQKKAPTPPPVPVPGSNPDKAGTEALLKEADQITATITKLRKLKKKKPIAKGVLSKTEIGDRLKAKLMKEYTPEEVSSESRVLKRLGLMPQSMDYMQTIMKVLMEQVAGFYDPDSGTLFIADWLGVDLRVPALSHELQHAIQDQHFNLNKMMKGLKEDGDAQLARSALIEGDAMGVMLEFSAGMGSDPWKIIATLGADGVAALMEGAIKGQSPEFDKAPAILKRTLMFPYLDGIGFIAEIRVRHPWSRVDGVFKNPPASTEQILHPEKYWAKEKPVKVKGAELQNLPGQKVMRADVVGEMQLEVMLAEHGAANSKEAAAGWGGDRLVAYATPGDAALPVTIVHASAWDAEADAIEFFVAAGRGIAKLAGAPTTVVKSTDTLVELKDSKGDLWSAERKADKVILIFGAHAAKGTAADLRGEVWQKFKFGK